jgi:hypothetical protein
MTNIKDDQNLLTISGVDISNANAGGDIISGVKNESNLNITIPSPDPDKIQKIITHSKQLAADSPQYLDMLEQLSSYERPRAGRPILGLMGKLKAGNREDLYDDAEFYKDKFAQRLARHQFSTQAVAIHLYFLTQINERFSSKILPLIKDGFSTTSIDSAISDLIIQPFVSEVITADPTMNADIIRGMLYFLTGNCHIKWSHP